MYVQIKCVIKIKEDYNKRDLLVYSITKESIFRLPSKEILTNSVEKYNTITNINVLAKIENEIKSLHNKFLLNFKKGKLQIFVLKIKVI